MLLVSLVGGYITLCKWRLEVKEDTNYFQHRHNDENSFS